MKVSDQLEMFGLEGARRLALRGGATVAEKERLVRKKRVRRLIGEAG